MPYLSVSRVGNKFRELANNKVDLDAINNLRAYKKYEQSKAERLEQSKTETPEQKNVVKPDLVPVAVSAETTAHVAALVAADKVRVAARNATKAASAASAKEPKEYTPPPAENYKDVNVMIKLIQSNIYRNTTEFNVGLTGLLNDLVATAIQNTVSAATDAKSLDYINSFVLGNNEESFWASFDNYSQSTPDLTVKVADTQETNIKAMFKKQSNIPVKKELLRQMNNLVFDVLSKCVEYTHVLSAYNNKKTLTKSTAVAIATLLNKSSLDAVNNFEAHMTAENTADAAEKEAKKAAAVPKVPKTPKAAPVAAPVAAVAAPVVITYTIGAPIAAAVKGKGKGKGASDAATPAVVQAPVAPANPSVSTLLAAAISTTSAPVTVKGKGKGKTT